MRFALTPLLVLLHVLLLAGSAHAVIKIETSLSQLADAATAVVVAEVSSVTPASALVDSDSAQTLSGKDVGKRLRVQVASPRELVQSVEKGQPLVVFTGKGDGPAIVHLADEWLVAQPIAGVEYPAFRVTGKYPAADTFPGTTAGLAAAMRDLAAGKAGPLNKIENVVFTEAPKLVATLPVRNATRLLAARVTGGEKHEKHEKHDLIVNVGAGLRFFRAKGDGYEDATEALGLGGASGPVHAAGDVDGDGKVDLLVGKTLYLNDGGRFTPLDVEMRKPALAAGLADANGDGKVDVIMLNPDGRMLAATHVTRRGPGDTGALPSMGNDKPTTLSAGVFGDFSHDGTPAALGLAGNALLRLSADGKSRDFAGLCGKPIPAALGVPILVKLDVNGDRRPDLFVLDPQTRQGFMLVNRGYGVFIHNPDAAAALAKEKNLPFALDATTVMAAADLQGDRHDELLVLAADGKLYAFNNPRAAHK